MAYLTASSAKSRDPRLADLDDDAVTAQIAAFTDIAERYRGVPFESTTATAVKVHGHYGCKLITPQNHVKIISLSAASLDGTALTSDELADVTIWSEWGVFERAAGWSATQVSLTYTYGYATTPAAILDACTEYVLCVLRARQSGVSRNTLSEATDAGTTRYSTPDWSAGRPTGWLEVDRLLNSLPDYRTPGIA